MPGKALEYLTPLTFSTDTELYELQRQPRLRLTLGLRERSQLRLSRNAAINDIDGYTDYAAITTPINTELYKERRNQLGKTWRLHHTTTPNPQTWLPTVPICLQSDRPNNRAVTPAIQMRFERDSNTNSITYHANMPTTQLSNLSINALIDTRRVLINNHRTWLTQILLLT